MSEVSEGEQSYRCCKRTDYVYQSVLVCNRSFASLCLSNVHDQFIYTEKKSYSSLFSRSPQNTLAVGGDMSVRYL